MKKPIKVVSLRPGYADVAREWDRECVYSPPRHETIREEEGQISRRATLCNKYTINNFSKNHHNMPTYICSVSSSLPAPIHEQETVYAPKEPPKTPR